MKKKNIIGLLIGLCAFQYVSATVDQSNSSSARNGIITGQVDDLMRSLVGAHTRLFSKDNLLDSPSRQEDKQELQKAKQQWKDLLSALAEFVEKNADPEIKRLFQNILASARALPVMVDDAAVFGLQKDDAAYKARFNRERKQAEKDRVAAQTAMRQEKQRTRWRSGRNVVLYEVLRLIDNMSLFITVTMDAIDKQLQKARLVKGLAKA